MSDIRNVIDQCTFSYTRQVNMKGLGHAILTGETLVGNEPFAVVLADDLCIGQDEGVLAQMVALYRQYKCSIFAIEEVDPKETHKYGIVDGKSVEESVYVVSSMAEKPDPKDAPSNLAVIGRYVLTPDIFDIIRNTEPGKNGEIQITDALQNQARKGMVLAYRFRGNRYDCGSLDGYVRAIIELYGSSKS